MLCFGPLEISFLFFYQLKMVGVGFNYTNPEDAIRKLQNVQSKCNSDSRCEHQ